MSPPSSRNPPPQGGSDESRSDRRNARTVLEVPTQASPAPPARPGEKRTMFGFALSTVGLDRGRAQEASPESSAEARAPQTLGVAIGRVAGVGQPAIAPPPMAQGSLAQTTFHVSADESRHARGMSMTEPQYVLPARAPSVLKEELSDALIAPVHRAPPAAFHGAPVQSQPIVAARLAHTPVPARDRHAAETHELPPVARSEPPSTLEMDDPYGAGRDVSAHAHASAAPLAAPVVSARMAPAPLEAPDVRTAFVDVRALAAAQQMALADLRGAQQTTADDAREDAAAWQGPSGSRPESRPFRGPPRSAGARPFGRQGEQESVDLDRVLGRAPRRTLLLGGVSAVVVVLAALSFLLRAGPSERAQLRAVSTPSAPRAIADAPRSRAVAAEQASATSQRANELSPTHAEAAAPELGAGRASDRQEVAEPSARPVNRQPETSSERESLQPAARAEHGGATPERAAILYIEGKYKQALAEYRLLATAYPSHKVYAELARILKRKIVDTCLRTQPNRREQCKVL